MYRTHQEYTSLTVIHFTCSPLFNHDIPTPSLVSVTNTPCPLTALIKQTTRQDFQLKIQKPPTHNQKMSYKIIIIHYNI